MINSKSVIIKKLIIMDVCNTLVNTNSTYSYIKYLIDNWVKTHYKFFFKEKIMVLLSIIFKIFSQNYEEYIVWNYFKWLNVEEIKKNSEKYFIRYEWKISKDLEKIILNNKDNDIVLLSAAINPPVDFLKNKFNINWFSSILEEKDWIYTWKIINPLRWKKETIFRNRKLDIGSYKYVDLITDNIDDINLIEYLNKGTKNFKAYIKPYKNNSFRIKYFNSNHINYEFIH